MKEKLLKRSEEHFFSLSSYLRALKIQEVQTILHESMRSPAKSIRMFCPRLDPNVMTQDKSTWKHVNPTTSKLCGHFATSRPPIYYYDYVNQICCSPEVISSLPKLPFLASGPFSTRPLLENSIFSWIGFDGRNMKPWLHKQRWF